MASNRMKGLGVFLLLALAFVPVGAEERSLGSLDSALAGLRAGGYVIYFRHAATEQSGRAEGGEDLARCETQRNLSAAGRQQAERIGGAVRRLAIPVGTVLSSPFCRCKDTARLAFGRAVVDPDLHFSMQTDAAQTRRLADSLRRLLGTPPQAGTNTVIVAHTANLREAAGLWPKPEGAAYVFRPLPGGRFEPVAAIPPEDWTRVVGLREAR